MNVNFHRVAAGLFAAACMAAIAVGAAPVPPSISSTLSKPGQVMAAAATQGMAASAGLHAHPAEIKLWPATPPDAETIVANLKSNGSNLNEVVNWRVERDSITGESFAFPTVTNIHFPTLTPFLPSKEKATGAAVVIAPGGGHQFHTINHEGYDVAKYLADRGVAAFVLKYRLARATTYPANTYSFAVHAMADGQRAMRTIRANAKEWNINPDHIGIMGFSAGGEVAVHMNLNAASAEGKPDAADPIDRLSAKINFEALVYPGVSRLIQPTKDWPAVFLACSFDDRADIAGSAAPANAATRPAAQGLADVYLRYKAVGVPADLHIFSTGGHGFGARERGISESKWLDVYLGWMRDLGHVK